MADNQQYWPLAPKQTTAEDIRKVVANWPKAMGQWSTIATADELAKKKEEAKVLLEMEKNNKKANEVQVDEILSWASRFDDASYEAKHLVIAQLVDRIEIRKNDGYDITIHWRMTAEQFLGRKKEESAW